MAVTPGATADSDASTLTCVEGSESGSKELCSTCRSTPYDGSRSLHRCVRHARRAGSSEPALQRPLQRLDPGLQARSGRAAELRRAAAVQHHHRPADRHHQHRGADRQDRHRHLPAALQADRAAAGLRDRRHRLLRRPHRPGDPLHPRRPVPVQRVQPARRRQGNLVLGQNGQPISVSAKGTVPGPRWASSTSPTPPSRATTSSPEPPPAAPAASSARASSRPRASTRSGR